MIEIKYNTRVFVDPKTKHIKIRVRWNKTEETAFSLEYRADPDKWDSKTQRPIPGTMHKLADQNCSARIIITAIEDGLDQIKTAFKKCEIDSVMPSREILKTMVRGEQPQKEIKLQKTLAELYEDFLETMSDDKNWTEKVHYKYQQTWNHLNACCPGITLDQLTKMKMRELKNWYINEGYRNVTINKMFVFLKTFLKWLKAEGYEIQPGVLEYKTNLIIVPKTITFLTYKELMDFYNYRFAEDEKNLELTRDMFCFMAFTSLRYSDLENLKKANVFDDHIEICTKKTHDKLSIHLIPHAKEIINKYKDEDYKNGKMFRVYANQKINELLKEAAKKAGLDKEVVQIYYQGTTRHEEVNKFHDIIGCHDARRTFVCCSLAFGIPPTVVMSCTGHSTYNAMKPYIEVADETQRIELAKWDKAEKQNDIKGDIAKKLEGVDEATLIKVLELLKSA